MFYPQHHSKLRLHTYPLRRCKIRSQDQWLQLLNCQISYIHRRIFLMFHSPILWSNNLNKLSLGTHTKLIKHANFSFLSLSPHPMRGNSFSNKRRNKSFNHWILGAINNPASLITSSHQCFHLLKNKKVILHWLYKGKMQLGVHAVNFWASLNLKWEHVRIKAACFKNTKPTHSCGHVKTKLALVAIIVGCVFKLNWGTVKCACFKTSTKRIKSSLPAGIKNLSASLIIILCHLCPSQLHRK